MAHAGDISVTVEDKSNAVELNSKVAKDQFWKSPITEFASRHGTEINQQSPKTSVGLTASEAAMRLQRDGPNQFTPKELKPAWLKYLLQFTDPFMILLEIAGILSFIAYAADTNQPINWYLGALLEGVTFLSCTYAHFQEGQATSAMAAFKSMLPQKATVVREGKSTEIEASGIVVGDIIHVKIGDKVPADARLFWCQDLKLEMSSLTGEPNAISRSIVASEERDIEASNLVFNTAQCMEGEGYGIVYATGDHTFIGRIASLASETKESPTPMQREVLIFVSRLSVVALTMAIVFFLIGWGRQSFNKSAWIPAFVNGFVVIAVACVPEGLPVTVVSCLSIASARMAEQDCYVKQLSSVETLGSVTLICSDKTGTLTMNKMAVANFFFDLYRHSGAAMLETLPPSSMRSEPKMPTFAYMETIMGVCNRERFVDQRELTEMQVEQMEAISAIKPGQTMNTMRAKLSMALKDDSKRESLGGDPSERAMFQYVASRQSIELMRYKHAIELEVPFNSKNKFSLSVASFIDPSTKQPRKVLMMKGAPERVLARCKSFMLRGESVPIDDEFRQKYDDAYNTYGNDGERVLGFAVLELDLNAPKLTSETWPQNGYTFLGLVTLRDPPKPSVPPAIAIVRKAGIRVFMVTGDHHLTGAAIARQVGIISQEAITNHDIVEQYHCTMDDAFESHLHEFDAVVVTGAELESFTEERWDAVLSKKEVVFARTSPEQKLQIVTHAQKLGNIVAVTGDGVNDSPALKKADIGVAMGISGSDVSRDAAHVVLMKDDFAAIAVGVKMGRTIFDNITKTIGYTITHMLPEVSAVIMNLVFGYPLGLTAIMILFIDLGTEVAPAVSLAFEKSEADVMDRAPRNAATDRLVTGRLAAYFVFQSGLIETVFAMIGYFSVFAYYGITGGCLAFADAYFTSTSGNLLCNGRVYTQSQQLDYLAQAQTLYWVMIVGSQLFHIFACKARVRSLWEHGIFDNQQMVYGVLIEFFIMMFVVFVPWTLSFFGSASFPGFFWFLPLAPAALLMIRQELVKWYSLQNPDSWIAKNVNW